MGIFLAEDDPGTSKMLSSVLSTWGYEAILRVVRALQMHLRSYDSIGRYGGDEFLVVLPGVIEAQAPDASRRLREAVAEEWFQWNGQRISVSISAGLAVAKNGSEAPASALLKQADEALYEDKRSASGCARA